jgi:hypothetical protein
MQTLSKLTTLTSIVYETTLNPSHYRSYAPPLHDDLPDSLDLDYDKT